MKQGIAVLFGTIASLGITVACAPHLDTHEHDHPDEPGEEEVRTYLTENYPTRDQMLSVQECLTEKTGYEFPELPDDFGPERLTEKRSPDAPKPPDEVYDAHFDCVFALGLEDHFLPPWQQDAFRPE